MNESNTPTRSLEHYWVHIAKGIEATYHHGNPYEWSKTKMDSFIIHFKEQVIGQIEWNKSLADPLGIKTAKGTINYSHLGIPKYTTLWRIFNKRDRNSSDYNQRLFAIYFGYPSVEAYIATFQLRGQDWIPPLPPYLTVERQSAPYLGLQTFSLENATLFYGRNKEIKYLFEYLSEEVDSDTRPKDLIYLYGQSGVGKSSFLQAGIIPGMLENWDIRYSRRERSLELAESFELAIKDKTTLLLIDNLSDLFEQEDAIVEQELSDLFDHITNDLKQKSNRPLKIVLAIPPQYLNFVHDLIKKSEIQKFSISLSSKKNTIEENYYVKEVIKAATEIKNQLILIPSFGENHNLWRIFHQQVGFDFTLRYIYGSKEIKISEQYLAGREKRKKLIILDQLEEAITKPTNNSQFSTHPLMNENQELTRLSKNIADCLKKRDDVKIILSFRADHYGEIEHYLDTYLSSKFQRLLLLPLNGESVKQAIEGPLKDNNFKLKYYENFPIDMISLLGDDNQSSIAPALQIILKQLWDSVKTKDHQITKDLFDQHVKKQKKIIHWFLKQQIARLEKNNLT